MKDPTDFGLPPDEAEERVLREGFETMRLSPEAMQRIRHAVHQEWCETMQSKHRRLWRPILATAAAAVLAIGIGWNLAGPGWFAAPGAVIGHVAITEAPGLVQVRALRGSDPVVLGSQVREGQKIAVLGDSMVALEGGGNLRLAKGTRVDVVSVDAIRLRIGELYVDIPPGANGGGSLRILTDAGEFRHVGTQFGVASGTGSTRLRVREGQVSWQAAGRSSRAVTVSAGTEMVVGADGHVDSRQIPTAGRDWSWVESISSQIDIEGRPLIEYLQWYARETGRRLEMDDGTRIAISAISMHGDLQGLTLAEALSAVMSTTSLVYELHDGAIRVSSTRDSGKSRR